MLPYLMRKDQDVFLDVSRKIMTYRPTTGPGEPHRRRHTLVQQKAGQYEEGRPLLPKEKRG